jgi:DNA repair protein RadC
MAEPLLDEEGAPHPRFRPLHALPRALRPREKLAARGVRALAHRELLALAMGSGLTRDLPLRSAERLLARHGLRGLAELEWVVLRHEPGLTRGSAARLAAAFELGRRTWAKDGEQERPTVARPHEAWALCRDLCRARKEHLVGLYLDAQNGLLHRETISVGSLNITRTHPREILFPAIEHLAHGFLLVHNHPSGCLDPSEEDVAFTQGVQRAGELMGIDLYDHLIVARGGYTSLRERGVL